MPVNKRITIRDQQSNTFLIEFFFIGSEISIKDFQLKISNAMNEWKKTKEFSKYSKQMSNGLSILDLYNLLSTYYMKHKKLRESIKNQGFTKFNIYRVDFLEIPKSDLPFFPLTKDMPPNIMTSDGVEISDYEVGDLTEILAGSQRDKK